MISSITCTEAPLVTASCFPRSEGFLHLLYQTASSLFQKCHYRFADQEETCCIQVRPDVLSKKVEVSDWNCQKDSLAWIKKFYGKGWPIPQVTGSLIDQVKEEFQEVAKNMGASSPDQFNAVRIKIEKKLFADSYYEVGASVDAEGKLTISPEWAFALNGWPSAFSPEEVRGVLAHETAHVLLKHIEKREQADAKNLLKEELDEIYRTHELEADMLATIVPEYGLGLKHTLKHMIKNCGQQGFMSCYSHTIPQPGYPSTFQRIDYLTKALCSQYPNDPALCSLADKKFTNATCPVFTKVAYIPLPTASHFD